MKPATRTARQALAICVFALPLTATSLAQPPAPGRPVPTPIPTSNPAVNQVASAQAPLAPPDQSKWPLKFEVPTHDFGRIDDAKPVEFYFVFKNEGPAPVNITNIRTSCGCSAAVPDGDKRSFAPGESGKIKVTFDPRGRRGEERKTITIETDAKENPNIELRLRSVVLPRLLTEPSTVYFGEVPIKDQTRTQDFTITARFPGFAVNKVTPRDERVKVETLPPDTIDDNGETLTRLRYRLTMPTDLPLGNFNSVVVIDTNDTKQPQINVPILAIIVGELRLQPERVLVRMSGPAQPFIGEAVVTSRDNAPFSISSVEPYDTLPEMKITVDLVPSGPTTKNSYRVRVAGLTPRLITDIKGGVRIRTDRKEMPTLDIPLMGMWTGQMVPQAIPGVGGGPKQ